MEMVKIQMIQKMKTQKLLQLYWFIIKILISLLITVDLLMVNIKHRVLQLRNMESIMYNTARVILLAKLILLQEKLRLLVSMLCLLIQNKSKLKSL